MDHQLKVLGFREAYTLCSVKAFPEEIDIWVAPPTRLEVGAGERFKVEEKDSVSMQAIPFQSLIESRITQDLN